MIECIPASLSLPLPHPSCRKLLHNDNRLGDNGFNGRKYTRTNTHTRVGAQCVHTHCAGGAQGSEVLPVLLIVSRPSEIIYQIWNNPDIPAAFQSFFFFFFFPKMTRLNKELSLSLLPSPCLDLVCPVISSDWVYFGLLAIQRRVPKP